MYLKIGQMKERQICSKATNFKNVIVENIPPALFVVAEVGFRNSSDRNYVLIGKLSFGKTIEFIFPYCYLLYSDTAHVNGLSCYILSKLLKYLKNSSDNFTNLEFRIYNFF